MIYDCMTFFNELDMLELRLNILDSMVDKFVIVEGNKTHTGSDKEFILEKNFDRFSKWSDKIIYIKVEDFPELKNSDNDSLGNNWLYENYQRDCIIRGLKDAREDDIIFTSDCDEIWNPVVLKKFLKNYKGGIYSLKLFNCYYSYNTVDIYSFYTKKSKVCYYRDLINPMQEIKGIEYCKHSCYGLPTYLRFCKGKNIYASGWHFSYINDIESIILKRQSIVEQQYNTKNNMKASTIKSNIEQNKDILGQGGKFVNLEPKGFLPQYIIDNYDKYSSFINTKNNISFLKCKLMLLWAKIYSDRTFDNKRVIKFLGIKFKKDVEKCYQ